MVRTRPKVVIEEFEGGLDQVQSGDRGVLGWSGPGSKW